jgi:integrase
MAKGSAKWGFGSVFLPNSRSSTYRWKLSVDGVQMWGSTGTRNYREALKVLEQKRAEKCTGHLTPVTNKVTVSDLVHDYLENLKLNAKPSYQDMELQWRLHLAKHFGNMKAVELTTTHLQKFKSARMAEGAAPASINRALEVLRAAYRRGASNTPPKVMAVPRFEMMDVKNVREGFVETPEYVATVAQCRKVGDWMMGIYETGHTFGWRKEEVLGMRIRQIDTLNRAVRIAPGTTKDRAGRLAYMSESLYRALLPLLQGKKPDDYVFTRPNGEPVKDFDKTWWGGCVAVDPTLNRMFCRVCKTPTIDASKCANPDCGSDNIGYRGRLYHDLRRTAVTNMVNSGIPEKVAMMISGHRTASVFREFPASVRDAI